MKISSKLWLIATCFLALVFGCKEKPDLSISKKVVNKKQSEKDLANERWLKVEELIKYGHIKDSADFMDQVNAIMNVKDHKRSSFVSQTTSVDANGVGQTMVGTVKFSRSKGVVIRPGDKDYEASISNLRGDNSTLNIKLLCEELAVNWSRPVWRCIGYDGVVLVGRLHGELEYIWIYN